MSIDRLKVEKWLILAIAAHSFGIGVVLLFLTQPGAALGGFPEVVPLFFACQGGIFHIVVSIGYLLDYFRFGSVTFLLLAKIMAVAFLVGEMVVEPGLPWTLPVSAVGDGLMALVVYCVHRWARHTAG